ncbi:MAG: hypothetical protein Q8P20_08725 [bacterium]|nr:hypothetical protein [bacterium]
MKKTTILMVLVLLIGTLSVSGLPIASPSPSTDSITPVSPSKISRGNGVSGSNYKIYRTVYTKNKGAFSCYSEYNKKNIPMITFVNELPTTNPKSKECNFYSIYNKGRNFRQHFAYVDPLNIELKIVHRMDKLATIRGLEEFREKRTP